MRTIPSAGRLPPDRRSLSLTFLESKAVPRSLGSGAPPGAPGARVLSAPRTVTACTPSAASQTSSLGPVGRGASSARGDVAETLRGDLPGTPRACCCRINRPRLGQGAQQALRSSPFTAKQGDSRAGELVRERGGEEHPARRGTTEVEEVKKSAVTAVREGEGHGFFSLRYSL